MGISYGITRSYERSTASDIIDFFDYKFYSVSMPTGASDTQRNLKPGVIHIQVYPV